MYIATYMAYKTQKLLEQAKKAIADHDLVFIEDVVAYLPCSKPAFYDHFKLESDELNEIKDLLTVNRVHTKLGLRKKWKDSDNATLQLALYKLLSEEEELKKLAMEYKQHSGGLTIDIPPIKWVNGEGKDQQ